MANYIDRQEAIDAVRSYYDEEYGLKYSIEELIEKLPPRMWWKSHDVRIASTEIMTGAKYGNMCMCRIRDFVMRA